MLLELDEFSKVSGEIYKITNTVNNKCYIGQTRSHRLNHKKYRPFGSLRRFKDHICEANSNKKNQSRYLNSAILKYGSDKFNCEIIHTCKICELDLYERKYIEECGTKYPNGYNLTDGGQGLGQFKGSKITLPESEIVKPVAKERINKKHSDYTKTLIAQRLKEFKNTDDNKKKQMEMTQKQHLKRKFERFKNVIIDKNNIDKYMFTVKNNVLNYEYIKVSIEDKIVHFIGRYEGLENIKNRARTFIQELIKWQCDQIAGTPLESQLPLDIGNLCEELG